MKLFKFSRFGPKFLLPKHLSSNSFVSFDVEEPAIRPLIGLEIHAQLRSRAKVFSNGGNEFTALPNSQLDLLDIAIPGSLPQLNSSSIRDTILSSLALGCEIQNDFYFDRKNYFYADMPAGFQITQSQMPIAIKGYLKFLVLQDHKARIPLGMSYDIHNILYKNLLSVDSDSSNRTLEKTSKIKQVQLEQDSAKTFHENDKLGGEFCLVDHNRSGSSLIEIVFEPDLDNPDEAASLVRELILVLKTLGTCECELQEGSLRVDANVSVIKANQSVEEVSRVELKNLNSLKNIKLALRYEIDRQTKIVENSGSVLQETRTYDSKAAKTMLLRCKETDTDYRIIPEPSIPPIHLTEEFIRDIKSKLPIESHSYLRKRLEKYSLSPETIMNTLERPDILDLFFKVMENFNSFDKYLKPDNIADFLLYVKFNLRKIPLDGCNESRALKPDLVFSVLKLVDDGVINLDIAYELFKLYFVQNAVEDPMYLVTKYNWELVDDDVLIEKVCRRTILTCPSLCKKYKATGDLKYLRVLLERIAVAKPKYSLHKCATCFKNLLQQNNNKKSN